MAKKSDAPSIHSLLSIKVVSPPSVLFLQGEEPFFIDRYIARLEAELVPAAEADFNKVILYGKDCTMMQILGQARQYPFLGDKQLVLVKEAQLMDDLNKEDGLQALGKYLDSPSSTTILVFAYKGKELDGRKSLTQKLIKANAIYTSPAIDEGQIPVQITALLRQSNLSFDERVPTIIAELVGNDMATLANEVQKLALRYGTAKKLERDQILDTVGISREYNVFELIKALSSANVVKALTIADNFASSPKEHPIIKELAMLNMFFLRLHEYFYHKAKGETQIAKRMNLNYYAAKDIEEGARRYSGPKVAACLVALLEADKVAKGASELKMEGEEQWQSLILALLP